MYLKGIPGDQGLAGPAGAKVSLSMLLFSRALVVLLNVFTLSV